jgi:uncharacterized protein YukE
MNVENMRNLTDLFNQKIAALKEIYDGIENSTKELDGTQDVWKGENQKLFKDTFQKTLDTYPANIKKFEEFQIFLKGVIDEYENTDKDLNKEININQESFDV